MKPDKMAIHGLTPSDMEAVLAEHNIEIPTGVGSNGSRSLAIGVIGGMILRTIALLYITPLNLYSIIDLKAMK